LNEGPGPTNPHRTETTMFAEITIALWIAGAIALCALLTRTRLER
jgi:hypothetical protein